MGAWHYPHNTPQPLEPPPVEAHVEPVKADEPQVIKTRPASQRPPKGASK